MKQIALALMIAATMGCGGTKKMAATEILKVEEATKQEWHSGRQEGGSGTRYTVTVVMLKEPMNFEPGFAWVDGERLKVNIVRMNVDDYKTPIAEGTRFILEFNNRSIDKDDLTEPPISYEGEALIEFAEGNEMHFLEIESFKEMERLNMP